MARQNRRDSASGIFHITIRGVGRQIIFEDDVDRRTFLKTLSNLLDEMDVSLYAWCLMRNHVHLLLKGELKAISKFMQRLSTSYSMFFNRRHEHVGHLLQSRFDSKPVETDEHFLMALCYIHQNPIRAGESPGFEYRWSSYKEYLRLSRLKLCEIDFALEMLGGTEAFERFHENNQDASNAIHERKRPRISDKDALVIIRRQIYPDNELSIASLPKDERNNRIRSLREAGLTVKQIERFTGIGRNIIQRA